MLKLTVLWFSASIFALPPDESTSSIPEEVAEVIQSSVGTWSVEIHTGDTTAKGKATIQLAPGGHCVVASLLATNESNFPSSTFLSGWDSSTRGFADQGLSSEGEVWTTRWSVRSKELCEGEYCGTVDGKKTTSKVTMERTSHDQIVVTVSERMKDSESLPDLRIEYRRLCAAETERKHPSEAAGDAAAETQRQAALMEQLKRTPVFIRKVPHQNNFYHGATTCLGLINPKTGQPDHSSMTLEKALQQNREPCPQCNPPRLKAVR